MRCAQVDISAGTQVAPTLVIGKNHLIALDAYNGTELWRYPLPGILRAYHGDHLMGTAGTHGVYCLGTHGVYVRHGERCLRLDPATGAKLGEFRAPKLRGGKRASDFRCGR